MNINKHIIKVKEEYELGIFDAELLQVIWKKKDEENVFVASTSNISKGGIKCNIKLGVFHDGRLVNVSRIVSKVTGKGVFDESTGSIAVEGIGVDLVSDITEKLYCAIKPKSFTDVLYDLKAVSKYTSF